MGELPQGTHTIELAVGDNNGVLRGKRIPAGRWEHVAAYGINLANAMLVWTPRCEIRDGTPYGNMETGFPDVRIVPIVETLRPVPWRPGCVQVLGRLQQHDGSAVPIDPRQALVSVLEGCSALGYEAKVGFEIEFVLLDAQTRLPREENVQCYGIARGTQYEEVLAPLRNLVTEFDIPIEASNIEYGLGQFEVNIRFGDALTTADNAVLFRNAVKEIAAEFGYLASFMAKPFKETGNGLHLHQSLWRDGRNVFANDARLSEIGRHYLGGLYAHMAELTLLGTPTPNGMKRREPYSFCPTRLTWGGDNRTVALRVIEEGRDDSVRIEQRDAAADCNPYLVMAGQIAAGLRGVEQELEPGPPSQGDAYADESAPLLPATIEAAIAALEASALVRDTFDPMLIEVLAGGARYEQAYLDAEVSDVERDRYLDVF